VFGESTEQPSHTPLRDELIGWGWIFVLYARTAIERGRAWQAEYGIAGARNNGLALACLRHELAITDARGIDELPLDIKRPWEAALVSSLALKDLRIAVSAAREAFVAEVSRFDARLADRLRQVLGV
jgi:hypothetical protein